MLEICITTEQRQVMTDAKLGDQCVYSAKLYAVSTTMIAQFGGVDVILAIWTDKWQRGKMRQKAIP
jgi:hypothetical protein